jgi:ubiquinone/menaquinone biosynthesis C-methylase UbiE
MSGWSSRAETEHWMRTAEERARMMAPATERMLALTAIARGARVLDVGGGSGEVALQLAELVGRSGSVVAIDISAPMIEATLDAARARGLDQIEAHVADAQSLDFSSGTFDAALARNVLMFVDDLHGTLSGIRRVLKRGGRFAACTWADLQLNPFNSIVIEAVRGQGHELDLRLELLRALALWNPVNLKRSFQSAGFVDVVSEHVTSVRRYEGLQAAMTSIRNIPMYSDVYRGLSEEDKRAALNEIERGFEHFVEGDGVVRFPIASLVTFGRAA